MVYRTSHRRSCTLPKRKLQIFSNGRGSAESFMPHSWARVIGNVVFEAEHDAGGHFAAHEKPELLAGDVKRMFRIGGPAYGVVSGKSGYSR